MAMTRRALPDITWLLPARGGRAIGILAEADGYRLVLLRDHLLDGWRNVGDIRLTGAELSDLTRNLAEEVS